MSGSKAQTIRQIILVAILLLCLGGFLLDRFYLMPSHEKKINEIVNTVTLKLTPENRKQVEEIAGKPNSTFTHKGLEVCQYRFPRGIPGFKRPMLDIAYAGDTIAFFRQDAPIDEDYINKQNVEAVVDPTKSAQPGEGEIIGSSGRRITGGSSPPKDTDDSDDEDSDSGDDDSGSDDSE
jgi:hypothetical protein